MVDVPRRTLPNDPTNPEHQGERVRNVVEGMNPRSGRGGSRWPAPVFRREVAQAGARGIGSRDIKEIRFKNDQFTITDDTVDTFGLTYRPIFDSWNVDMGWPWTDGLEYDISGQTLTALDPVDSFRGIADNGPRILQVEYAYLAGAKSLPSSPISYVGSLVSLVTSANFDFVLPSGVQEGDLMVAMWTAHFSWTIDPSWATWHYAEPGSTQALAAKYITTEGPGDPVFPSIGGSAFRSSGVMGIVRGVDPVTPYHDLQFGGSPVTPATDASRYAMHFASGYSTTDPAPLSRGTERTAGFVAPIGAVVADEVLAPGSYSVSSPGSAIAMASVVFNSA